MAVLHFPLYLCSITKMSWLKRSPCLSLNLMDRNPGLNTKSAFSATYCTPVTIHTNPSDLEHVLWNLQHWNFTEKHLKTFQRIAMLLSPCHLTQLQNCRSLKCCLIWGPINKPASLSRKWAWGNFPHKYVNAGPFTSKSLYKILHKPQFNMHWRRQILLGFIKVLCITLFIPGVNECLWCQCFLE